MAYENVEGLSLEPTMGHGRLLLSPNDIAKKFDREFTLENRQLELALFLDGVTVGKTIKQSISEFRTSWSRPKWHIVFKEE